MKALVFREKVVQIEADEFEVHEDLQWVDITGITPAPEVKWLYDGERFAAPPPVLSPPKSNEPLTTEELATHLINKGAITRAEITAIKMGR